MLTHLDEESYKSLIEARIFEPKSLQTALSNRSRRSLAGKDGRLLILAADHTARGKLTANSDPLAMADRFIMLDRIVRALADSEVDGVLASADILEELSWLGVLEGRLAIGTMNRGGVIGAKWELDDRMTAYDAEHVAKYGLDGGKMLLRIDDSDSRVARTIESVAAAITQLADRGIMCLLEPLPYVRNSDGLAVLDESDERLIKVVAIASGLGSSSAHTWLKIPTTNRMAEVAGATSMPILMLGGDPGKDTAQTFVRWKEAMTISNVRGLLAGRTLLYPNVSSVEDAVRQAAELVHGVTR